MVAIVKDIGVMVENGKPKYLYAWQTEEKINLWVVRWNYVTWMLMYDEIKNILIMISFLK